MMTNEKVEYLRAIKVLMEADLPVCTFFGERLEKIVENKDYLELSRLFKKIALYLIRFERKAQAKSQKESL